MTDVVRGLPSILQWLYKNVTAYGLMTPEEGWFITSHLMWTSFDDHYTGSRCTVYCATAKSAIAESRQYLGYFGSNAKPERPNKRAYSIEAAKELWKWSADTVDLPSEWDLSPRP